MKTKYSVIALGAMVVAFGAVAAGVSQDRIPYLEREAPTYGPKYTKTETLTGCVARGAGADTYILTSITKVGEATAKETLEPMSVVLSGIDVDVSKHVGHRVSVTGLYASDGHATGTAGTHEEPTVAGVPSARDKKPAAAFRVKSLVMVADSCSQSAD